MSRASKLVLAFSLIASAQLNPAAADAADSLPPGFELTKACAKATIKSGDTCSNVKAEIDFSACDKEHAAPVPAVIICSGQYIKARAGVGDFKAEARFKKVSDGWGTTNWTPSSDARTFLKATLAAATEKKAVTPVKAEAPAEPTRAAASEAAPTNAASAAVPSPLSVSAFFDMRYTGYRTLDSSINEKTRSGFLLEDGALYVSYKKDKLTGFVDLPFSRNGIITSTTADLGFAKSKAQVYAKYDFLPSLSLTFGQYDTIYGVELNDSKDRVFGNVGLAYSQALPIVHSGAYLTFAQSGFTARLMAANPSDRQTFGTDAFDSSTEYGA